MSGGSFQPIPTAKSMPANCPYHIVQKTVAFNRHDQFLALLLNRQFPDRPNFIRSCCLG